jgi:hypothetical protein
VSYETDFYKRAKLLKLDSDIDIPTIKKIVLKELDSTGIMKEQDKTIIRLYFDTSNKNKLTSIDILVSKMGLSESTIKRIINKFCNLVAANMSKFTVEDSTITGDDGGVFGDTTPASGIEQKVFVSREVGQEKKSPIAASDNLIVPKTPDIQPIVTSKSVPNIVTKTPDLQPIVTSKPVPNPVTKKPVRPTPESSRTNSIIVNARPLLNNHSIMGLSALAYSFLMAAMLWRNEEVALLRTIKDFLHSKNVDTFEDCMKYNTLRNLSLPIAQEIDAWYKEKTC